MEKISWIQTGSTFRRVEGNVANVEKLTAGIYSVNFDPYQGWFITCTAEKFTFPYKLYDLQSEFIDHVIKTFKNTNGNLGVLFNGVKGTGKTVSAKVLANKLQLPVINVKSMGDNNTSLVEYLSSFNFDCIFFFDEFEKTWSEDDSSILQFMDGALNSDHRRVFLLTTNQTEINQNLISRPSRIRYIKEFGNLEQSIVIEYLKDNLNDKECIDNVVDFVDTLQISTIDILKTIVEDINIHGYDTFVNNKEIFNINTANYYYEVYQTCFTSKTEIKEADYDINKFIKDIKLTETNKRPYFYQYPNEEAFNVAYNKWLEKRAKLRDINSYNIESNKSVKVLKIGDYFGRYNTEKVIQIDLSKKVVVTLDSDNYIYYYYVSNINTKPSLFNNPYAYAYSSSKTSERKCCAKG